MNYKLLLLNANIYIVLFFSGHEMTDSGFRQGGLEERVKLEERCSFQPIQLPDHPYVASLKDFGLDELLAGGVDAISTTLVSHYISGHYRNLALTLCGPVTEKVMFFPAHFKKAWDTYKTTHPHMRKSLFSYFKESLHDGFENLVKDILIHDPIYCSLMYLGLNYVPEIPPPILSMSSYVAGVLLVGLIDVIRNEHIHNKQKKELTREGFVHEKYYEARFLVRAEVDPHELMPQLRKEFRLGDESKVTYRDVIYVPAFKAMSQRKAVVRLRSRGRRPDEDEKYSSSAFPHDINSAQVVYTRFGERKGPIDQGRYYVAAKEKEAFLFESPISSIDEVTDGKVRELLQRLVDPSVPPYTINFSRTVAHNAELAICIDEVRGDRPYYILEAKVYKDVDLLKQAMRYIMFETPLMPMETTHSKSEMFSPFR